MFESYDEKVKAELFDIIASNYFSRNFGTMAKGDLEALLFSMMLTYLRENEPEKLSDYEISKILGITQSRVRNLKIKSELLHPRDGFEVEWKTLFKKFVANARYDENDGLVKLNIPDIAVLMELRNFMEENGWYDEYQLNPKLFQCKLDMFISLCEKLDGIKLVVDEKTAARIESIMQNKLNENEACAIELMMHGQRKDALNKFGKKFSKEFLPALLKTVPGSQLLVVLADALIEK